MLGRRLADSRVPRRISILVRLNLLEKTRIQSLCLFSESPWKSAFSLALFCTFSFLPQNRIFMKVFKSHTHLHWIQIIQIFVKTLLVIFRTFISRFLSSNYMSAFAIFFYGVFSRLEAIRRSNRFHCCKIGCSEYEMYSMQIFYMQLETLHSAATKLGADNNFYSTIFWYSREQAILDNDVRDCSVIFQAFLFLLAQ